MSILNAIKQNLSVKKAVIIGSGDIIQDIIDDFVKQLHLKPNITLLLKDHFEKKHGVNIESFSSHLAAMEVKIPNLIFHD